MNRFESVSVIETMTIVNLSLGAVEVAASWRSFERCKSDGKEISRYLQCLNMQINFVNVGSRKVSIYFKGRREERSTNAILESHFDTIGHRVTEKTEPCALCTRSAQTFSDGV